MIFESHGDKTFVTKSITKYFQDTFEKGKNENQLKKIDHFYF